MNLPIRLLVFALCALAGCRTDPGQCSGISKRLCVQINQGSVPTPTALVLSLSAMGDGGTKSVYQEIPSVWPSFNDRQRFVMDVDLTPIAGDQVDITVVATPAGTAQGSWKPGDPMPMVLTLADGADPRDAGGDGAVDKANPCGKDLSHDPMNCGACGNGCPGMFPRVAHCIAGQCAKRVFVTSQMFSGNMGGLMGADMNCQALANKANLGGVTFKAWLSEVGTNVAMRMKPSTASYTLVDGTGIAAGWTQFASNVHQHAINETETGSQMLPLSDCSCGTFAVWTNSTDQGNTASTNDCSRWSATTGGSLFGSSAAMDATWSAWASGGLNSCASMASLYCVEQ